MAHMKRFAFNLILIPPVTEIFCLTNSSTRRVKTCITKFFITLKTTNITLLKLKLVASLYYMKRRNESLQKAFLGNIYNSLVALYRYENKIVQQFPLSVELVQFKVTRENVSTMKDLDPTVSGSKTKRDNICK